MTVNIEDLTKSAQKFIRLCLDNAEGRHGIEYFEHFGYNEIVCKHEYQAEGIADLLEDMGFEYVRTGYYDPEEDKLNGEIDEYTGYYYVDWD